MWRHKSFLKDDAYKKVYSLVFPIIIDNAVLMIAGSICMAMLGRSGALAVGAYGISSRVIQIIYSFFRGITLGSTILVAQAYGAENRLKAGRIIQQTLLSSLILVMLLQQVIYWQGPMILGFFNPGEELKGHALSYLKILSFTLPFMAVRITASGVLQGIGNSKTPMKISMTMNTLYIIATYFFMNGIFGLGSLGMIGAAYGLVTAEMIAACLGLLALFGKADLFKGMESKSFFILDTRQILENYKVGLPVALESTFWQFSTAIMTRAILNYGENAFAGYCLGIQAESISYVIETAAGVAATSLIGQITGAGDYTLGKKLINKLTQTTVLITGVLSVLLLLFSNQIMGLLTVNREVIYFGAQYLVVMSFMQIPQNLTAMYNGAIRGAGFTKTTMILSGGGLWLIRIPFSLLCVYYFKLPLISIWLVMSVDLMSRFAVSYILYRKLVVEKSLKPNASNSVTDFN